MTLPLPCPELFSLESGVVYMDNASISPIPIAVELAAKQAVSSKARPWRRDRLRAQALVSELRERAAALVQARPQDIAVTCAASYGLAVARANLPVSPGERILVLEGDHTSQMLTWQAHAQACGAVVDQVARPRDGDWTRAITDHLANDDKRRIALASLCATFWIDGSRIDLPTVCPILKARGAHLVLDLTQSVGVLDADLPALQADFAVFPMYKWLLGPYSVAFLYVGPQWQGGEPLEQNSFNLAVDGGYAEGAARFDMGERDTFVGLPTSLAALELGAQWSRDAVRTHLSGLTGQIAAQLAAEGLECVPASNRSVHILGVGGLPDGVAARCREQGVTFTQRHGSVRISPHVFNTRDDADRCAQALLSAVRHIRCHS